jgi:pSer/pThr/pTyr-binding forkhead associated (FHA) protein
METQSSDIDCGDCPTSAVPAWATLPENEQVCLVQISTDPSGSSSGAAARPVECVYHLGKGRAFHIGRHSGERCIVVDDVTVSRRHALLVHKGNTLYLRDHSSNGSFINERQIGQSKFYAVRIGDILRFGDNPLRFSVSESLAEYDPALIVRERSRRRKEGSIDGEARSVTSLSDSAPADRPEDSRRHRGSERLLSIADISAASAATQLQNFCKREVKSLP